MKVEKVQVSELVLDPANVRKHPAKNIEAIKGSLARFGQQKPIVVGPGNVVIAGNGTLIAARELGWTEIDIVRTNLSGSELIAFGIADNRTSELAEWDDEALAKALSALEIDGVDLDDIGFSDSDIAALDQGNDMPLEEGDIPDAPSDPVTRPGDIWLLGDHRLLCGDSSDADAVAHVMAGEMATLVFTDPPYGVSIGAKNRMLNSFQKAGMNLDDIESDDAHPEKLAEMLLKSFRVTRSICADDCSIFVCAPQGGQLGMMMMMMRDAGMAVRHVLIWAKNAPTFSMGRLDYDYQHEPILFTWIKTHKRVMAGQCKTSLWAIDKPRASKEHPTMKPVELPMNAMLNHTDRGDVVYDPFLGSGTTLIAAEQLGRRCRAVEISPKYCDVAVQRWEALTGRKAVKCDVDKD